MIFSVTNSRTSIVGADSYILKILDKELRYPTQIANALESYAPIVLDNSWDGWVRLLHQPKTMAPWFPTGLLSIAKRHCEKFGYKVQLVDRRVRPESDIPELVDIPLRDYQKDAVERAVTIGRGVIDCPPRSGKTRCMIEIVRRVAQPTLWIAPTDRIVTQTQSVIEGFLGSGYSTHLVGSKTAGKVINKRIVVCTAATAIRLPSEFYKSRECVVVDEFHHSASKSYRWIFDQLDHAYFRFGMTGTYFRSGDDIMAMHSLLSTTIYKITSEDLLKLGYLVPSYVVFIPVLGPKLRGVDSSFQLGHGKYGVHEHKLRQQMVAHAALLLWKLGRKVLILVGTKAQGRMLRDILLSLLPKSAGGARYVSVEFVSTDMPRFKQQEVLNSFEGNEEVKILIGTSILGEGVDLPTADALVYAKGEKAEVTLTQNMYRTCTATEGKINSIVVDFSDRHHRKLLSHSMDRCGVYYRESTFNVTVLDDPRQYPQWLNYFEVSNG